MFLFYSRRRRLPLAPFQRNDFKYAYSAVSSPWLAITARLSSGGSDTSSKPFEKSAFLSRQNCFSTRLKSMEDSEEFPPVDMSTAMITAGGVNVSLAFTIDGKIFGKADFARTTFNGNSRKAPRLAP